MLARPNARPLVDHNRPRVDGVGIFTQRNAPTGVQIGNRRMGSQTNDLRSIVSGQAIELSIDRALNPSFEAKPGDHVVARGRRFGVVNVRPDGQARTVLSLEEIQ